MSLLSIFGTDYKPTAIFSFEFFERKANGTLGTRYGEIFFLIPPENYSIQEGYRVNLTKTSGGGWVDDFGSDFKKIRLAGSLYSYYTGYLPTGKPTMPTDGEKFFTRAGKPTMPTDGEKFFTRAGKAIAGAVISAVQQAGQVLAGAAGSALDTFGINIPGLSGMSGLEEFFKLRYILSRFRDEYTLNDGARLTSKVRFSKDKNIDEVFKASKEHRQLFDKLGIVYHDYDDNNHFEVIFDSFSMGRDKADPFTVTYSIEMTAIKEFLGGYINIGKIVKKENPYQVFSDFTSRFQEFLNNIQQISQTPSLFAKQFLDIYNFSLDVYNRFTDFTKAVTTDWTNFTNFLDSLKQKNVNLLQELFILSYGQPYDELQQENSNLTDPVLLYWTDVLESGNQLFSEMKGTEKYLANSDPEKVFTTGNKTLLDSDFKVSTEADSSKIFVANTKTYYEVKQGDTLQSLGNLFFGDPESGSIIAEANKLVNGDFENEAMVGKSIVVPLFRETISTLNTKNLVYFKKLDVATILERQLQILGADFNFNDAREIIADGSGDIAMLYGEDAFRANLTDRLQFELGTLNPFDPAWGIQLNIGNVPTPIALSKILDNIEEQVYRDPRVETINLDRENIDVVADQVRIMLSVKAYSGSENIIDVGKMISTLL